MPILSGDIKLVASQVMDDVPEGGGAPTATAIADGTSNAIFPDVSELDRAGGRVNMRKLHVHVQTTDRDTYMGSNIIVAEPPADPNISVTMFTTESTFDRRDAAASRVESYLTRGPVWGGCLLENHITGQRSIQILQPKDSELPTVGKTMVLVLYEGLSNEVSQFVRVTSVSYVVRVYRDENGKSVDMWVVTLNISDALRTDFIGTPGSVDAVAATGATKVRDTTVADAGSYVGVVPLAVAADIADFTVTTTSVYTQLVPSAQTETPISDVRTNGLSTALVPTGDAVTQTLSLAFTTTQNLFLGGPVYPASLSIVRSGITLIDKGGVLVNVGVEVGTVDYDNGIVTLATNVWGTSGGSHVVTFKPATVPDLISDQRAIRVSADNRSLSYAFTMDDIPLARTMSVSYMAQGRWYVLRDDGAGVLKGVSSAYGAGTVSYTTGSVSVTLGALPDVGSSIVIQSYSKVTTIGTSNSALSNAGKLYVAINSDGDLTEEKGSKVLAVGKTTVQWSDDAVTKYAYDDSLGNLFGDATGTIDYPRGVLRISPNTLPAAGTTFVLRTDAEGNFAYSSAGARIRNQTPQTFTLPGTPDRVTPAHTVTTLVKASVTTTTYAKPGTVSRLFGAAIHYLPPLGAGRSGDTSLYKPTMNVRAVQLVLLDNGMGGLYFEFEGQNLVAGSIDYETSQITLVNEWTLALPDEKGPRYLSQAGYIKTWNDLSAVDPTCKRTLARWLSGEDNYLPPIYTYTEPEYQTIEVAELVTPGTNPTVITLPQTPPPPTVDLASAIVSAYLARAVLVPNYTLKGVGFKVGTTQYLQLIDGTLVKDVLPTTGGGTPAGSVTAATGTVTINAWDTGAAPQISEWRGIISPPSVGVEAPFTAFSTIFRTAASPLRPASLSVLGTLQDGTTFNVTASSTGKIDGTRVKGVVDYEYGLVSLYFVNPDIVNGLMIDLTHLQIPGLSTAPADLAMLNSLRYNAVSYSYLPLDADLLGIDPVRLPSDGRVPIFRAGGFAVVGNTQSITATVSNAQTIDCARVRLSRVRVVGFNGTVINTGYTTDLEAGTVTFTDVTGYSQPVTIEHRIEDMAVVSDVQISGEITFTRPLTHDYPLTVPPTSFVSSALVAGDLKSRVSVLFDQTTWTGVWSDATIGTAATGTFNDVIAPIEVTNKGAVTERWAMQFTSSSAFQIVGEHVGVIGSGVTNAVCAPQNPSTLTPYFTIPELGWGSGWSVGNVLRFNTVGAMAPVWVVRTVQQGPNTGTSHSFTLLSRGDVDRP